MALTYTSLKDKIGEYTQNFETSFQDNLDTFILQTEDRIYKRVILPANRIEAQITLTNGQTTAPVPADFIAPFSLLINNVGMFTPVEYTDVSLMREAFPNPLMVGVPRWYSMYDASNIVLSPTPSAGLTGWLRYFHKPESITTAASGTSWLGDNAENCLLMGCLSEAYGYIKSEPDMLQLYEGRFQSALNDLAVLGEGMDLGDAYRMGERRVPNKTASG